MKILFAIQGTGNGHLSRARDVYPELAKYGEVDVLISGIQADVNFPYPVKYKLYGMSFIFGKKGGVDMFETAKKLKLFKLISDIRKLPVEEYDLVVNDFEPVSAWACKMKKKPCISLSHQSAVLNEHAPQPKNADWKGEIVLKHYAPVTAAYGFHFKAYGDNIFTPVIRQQIRDIKPTNEGHYTVYLPAYDDETMLLHLSQFEDVKWQVFSKHNKSAFTQKNVSIQPIENDAFIRSMASSTGVLCGAGFEGPAEALFLGKKVLAIPMQEQYEQHCNAAAMKDMKVPVINHLGRKYYNDIRAWLQSDVRIEVNYPNITADVVAQLMHEQVARPAIPAISVA
ncbi:MAG: glycosyl transferase [Sphingobacteriales bacterium]|nr:MAG: glycosyl transferase [Sphingobacteriales bacterium]